MVSRGFSVRGAARRASRYALPLACWAMRVASRRVRIACGGLGHETFVLRSATGYRVVLRGMYCRT